MHRRFRFYKSMWIIEVAALSITLFPAGWTKWTLLIDWRIHEVWNRWRLDVGAAKRWQPLGYAPTKKGRYWAWFAKGNEMIPKPGPKPWYGLDTIVEPEDKPVIP